MKRYVSKPQSIFTQQWEGTADSPLIAALNRSGWTTMIQFPASGEMVNAYNEQTSQWEPMAARERLVIIGPYRKQLYSLNAGQYLSWHEEDSSFGSQDGGPSERDWDVDPDAAEQAWPTPAELVALADLGEVAW